MNSDTPLRGAIELVTLVAASAVGLGVALAAAAVRRFIRFEQLGE